MKGFYLHVPFCLQKCHYCDFVITTRRSGNDRKLFFQALEKEARHVLSERGRLVFDTLYLGGGTPSALEGGEMEELLGKVRNLFGFNKDFELTCEVNPGDVDEKKLTEYRKAGVNRISLGVQAFQDSLLRDMGRAHTVEDTLRTIQMLHGAGFENISFDLIAGLPGQTQDDFYFSLSQLIELGASQLSLYDLDVHEATVYGRRRREGQLRVPDEETRARMYELACEKLPASGYRRYEISTFARPGFESRHNLIYWHNQEYLGLGPGAYSYLGGKRFQTAPDVRRWLEKSEKNDWVPDTCDVLTDEERETETLFTGLRLAEGIDLEAFPLIRARVEERLLRVEDQKLFERVKNRLTLSPRGRLFVERSLGYLIEKSG